MALSSELISQFVKITNDSNNTVEETTVYGTIVEYEGDNYVRLDGSELLTPITTAANVKPGERVTVMIKNHTATVTGNLSSPSARIDDLDGLDDVASIISEFEIVLAQKVDTEDLVAEQARIDALIAKDVEITGTLEAAEADIDILQTNHLTVLERLEAAEADIENLVVGSLDVTTLDAKYAKIGDLEATNADVYNLESTYADFEAATANKFTAVDATIADLDAAKLSAGAADIRYAKISDLDATNADITDLEADIADIDTLIFGSASGKTIHSSFANAVIAQLANAQIKSAMIDSVSADKINAGDINTNKVRVMSEDGSLYISDETIQITDDNRVRVQIGKDAAGDYSINIWDASGNLMFSEGGITSNAIKNAIIRNDMVSETANISASKLNIDSLFKAMNGSTYTLKSSRIYLDDKAQTLDVAFKAMESDVSELGETVSSQGTQLSVLQGKIESKVWQQDINTATNQMSTQYSTLEQELDGVAATVASHNTEINNKADSTTVTKVTDRVSELETNLTGFKSTVGETYATKTEVSDIDIGGRNLLLNTGGNALVVMNNGASAVYSQSVLSAVNESGTLTINGSTSAHEVYYRFMNPAYSYNNLYGLEPGKKYTLSGKARVTTTSGTLDRLVVRAQNYTDGIAWWNVTNETIVSEDTEDWVDFAVTFTNGSDISGCFASVQLYYIDSWDGTIQLKNLQLEKGNKATAWAPAPEDYPTVESVADAKSSADAAQESIDNLVVGGRNLLLNSKTFVGANISGKAATISETYKEFTVRAFDATELAATYEDIITFTNLYADRLGETYTLSFYAKGAGEVKLCTYFHGGNNYVRVAKSVQSNGKTNTAADGATYWELTEDWQRYWVTWTLKNEGDISVIRHILFRLWSGGAVSICGVKLEKGHRATDWTIAPEDLEDRIKSSETKIEQNTESITLIANRTTTVENKFSGYSTTEQMNAAIKQSADGITSSVSKTYTTKEELTSLNIGGRNLVAGTDDITIYTGNATGISNGYEDTWTAKTIVPPTGTEYVVSFDAKADVAQDVRCYFYSPNTTTRSVSSTGQTSTNADGYSDVSITTEWARYWVKWTQNPAETNKSIIVGRNFAESNIYIRAVKFEAGNKATDWSPAPEDMVTGKEFTSVENTLDSTRTRMTEAESLIQQLSESIMTLVTDGNGESLMVQTESGWTFSTAQIQDAMSSASENLNKLTDDMGDVNTAVNALKNAVDDLGVLNDYVKIGTYENEPCIELGESDSDFKLMITNTRIMFMEGSGIPAYINNQSLHIKKAVVEEELQQGDFVWQVRSNGNLGLIWKGANS